MIEPVTPLPEKVWYRSKILWAGILTALMGILQLITPLVATLAGKPDPAGLSEAIVTFLLGVAATIWRVWFTDTVIK